MHLLFVGSLLPEAAPATGFDIATRAIVDGLERAGARLTLLGFRRPGTAPPGREGTVRVVDLGPLGIENSGAGRLTKAAWVARALGLGLPVAAAKLSGLGEAALLARIAEAGPFDGIVLNSVQMPAAYPALTRSLPFLYVAHNVEHASAAQNAANADSAASRFLFARESRLLARIEADLCARARRVACLTDADRAGLGVSSAKGVVLPLTLGRRPHADDGRRTHDVGLIGTWSWAPNRVGLDWFVREVAPRLPADIRVAVAGRFDGSPPPAPANVAFLGRVPDASAFVRASRVLALATKGGTGIQLKTIEALEEGMPAVATPEALRGVCEPPDNLAVRSDPAAFAEALVALVEAERRGERLRADGSRFAAGQRAGLAAALAQAIGAFAPAGSGAPARARTPVSMSLDPEPVR
ncbi:glycosyltransferase [Antarcticirhabdus aurantiaca]|uniref:Glycosyltransferase n=1 Tax=Antarcticirhabdus aurantiaca TaxID=2606717 RepID=A0ACD4NPQ8_9HYPH|nr:glycosyltransferase [Antarcticirhabdus aurantiaca]WAJ28823.1 glycosyltransferase [Jeongeuplla avenae]